MDKSSSSNLVHKVILGAVGLVVLCGLSFYGGLSYQKGKQPSPQVAQTNVANGGFGGRFGRGGGIGSVTAVSPSSITVNNTRTSTSKTYTINSSTTITNSGATATVADITTGSTVLVTPSSSDPTIASTIILNPSFGPGGGSLPGGSDSGASTDSQVYTN